MFELLRWIPPEIFETILEFSNGVSMSTLALACATSGDESYRRLSSETISRSLSNRLENLSASIESSIQSNSDAIVGAVSWIRAVNIALNRCNQVQTRVSEAAAVVDLLELSLANYSNEAKGQYMWPVWCGQISVDTYDDGSKLRNTARVEIVAPIQWPSYIPGCTLMRNRTPTGSFLAEPYNLVAIPPWGRILGLNNEESRVLMPLIERLDQTGLVGVPKGYDSDPLDIRILASSHARALPDHISPPITSWLLDGEYSSLVCCWHDDSDGIRTPRDYVGYVVDLLKARRRLLR